jgi:glutaredoxin
MLKKTQLSKLVAACALITWAAASFAQPVYRIVGPDGKVSFSDKPPAQGEGKASGQASGSGGAGASGAALPFELRQVSNKFPVTLYTGDNCSPCQSARSMLITRGVPFTEKTVKTNDDIQALQRLSGESSLPFGTIGGQQLKGYSDSEWTQFLNAAGYPAISSLPSSYRQAAATPMVAATAAPVAATRPAAKSAVVPDAAPTAAPVPAVTPANPSGIRF